MRTCLETFGLVGHSGAVWGIWSVMAGKRLTAAAISIGILAGMSATAVCAAPAKAPPTATFTARDAFAPDLNQWGPQQSHRALQWDNRKGRWGLKLDYD